MIKTFEIFNESKKKGENGKRKFKMVLYKIYPDSVIDEENGVGTEYNLNGITWIEKYCRAALDSIKGMFLRVEFLDDKRTEICGHGMTEIADGTPLFENATVIGVFTDGYIDEIEEDGKKVKVCIGVGEIDSSCYHSFCEKLDEDLANGIYPQGSIEIMKIPGNSGIGYLYGYKDKGRIPTEFIHSGYAIIGIPPADRSAKMIELNEHKEDKTDMTDVEMNALVAQIVSTYTKQEEMIAKCKEDCEKQVSELNAQLETVTSEKNEAIASSEKIQKALDDCRAEFNELDTKYSTLCSEMEALRKELGEAKARERIGEMNAAIADFSDAEKEYAKEEIEAFNSDPINSEINAVVSKIYEGIGKASKAAQVAETKTEPVVEQNAQTETAVEDIFSAVEIAEPEDTSIF